MKDRKEMSQQFKEKRDANHRENVSIADKTRWRGTYYEGGIGNPRSFRVGFMALSPEARLRKAQIMERFNATHG